MPSRTMEFAGREWVLHPHKALIDLETKTATIADCHFGKASLFRARGLPVPSGTTASDLGRLDAMLAEVEITRLVVLGDFFHGKAGRADSTMSAISAWRAKHASLTITLVRGNHDLHAGDPPSEWDIECHTGPLEDDGILLTHEPYDDLPLPSICGHVHPSACLRDFDGSRLRLPCFVVEENRITLPAFGRFCGSHTVSPAEGRTLYLVANNKVVPARSKSSLEVSAPVVA